MLIALYFLSTVAVALVAMSVLPLIRRPYWWVRTFDFPRLQIAFLALITLVALTTVGLLEGALGGWIGFIAAALGATVVYQLARVLPYTPLWKRQVVRVDDADRDRCLRLVVSNVLMSNREGDRWLDVIRSAEADVILAVETDDWWAETGSALREDYPHGIDHPLADAYGMCLYSRLELQDVEVANLLEDGVPSLFGTIRLRGGARAAFAFVHPRPPRPDLMQGSQLRDGELVLAAQRVRDLDLPVVVAGDLNDVAWSATTRRFKRLSGLLDPRVGRGLFATFHAHHWWLRYPLDHVFHSASFGLVEMRRLPSVGSDHFPILLEIALDEAAARVQRSRETIEEDDQAAHEAVAEAEAFLERESEEERKQRREADV